MRTSSFLAFLVVVPVLISCCGNREKPAVDRLPGSADYPEWAAATAVTYTEGKPWSLFGNSRKGGAARIQGCVGKLRYVVEELMDSPDRPYILLRLTEVLSMLDLNRLAVLRTDEILALPDSTAHNAKIHGLPTLDDVKKSAWLVRSQVLVRNGLGPEAVASLDSAGRTDGYGALIRSYVLACIGDTVSARAALSDVHVAERPKKGFSDVHNRMRAALIARAVGADSLARTIAEPILSQEMTLQKWPQWQSAWSILEATIANIDVGPLPPVRAVADGTYLEQCRGFVGPIEVETVVRDGALESVRIVSNKEDRPWSALDVVPARMVRANSLLVDAVSGATVTSCAVMAAVDRALTSAVRAEVP